MNKTILILCLLASGCSWNNKDIVKPEIVVAKSVQYVVKIPPAEALSMPEPVAKVDVDTAKQSDIASWLVSSEARTKALEDKLIGLAAFFKDAQTNLDNKAAEENKQFQADAIKAQADAANAAVNKPIQK